MGNNRFLDRLSQNGVLISDGATGSNLQARGLERGVASELWVLENPPEIVKLHHDFICAGSDIILTCTFGGTPTRLAQHQLSDQVDQVNQTAVELARKAAEGTDTLIAGSIGPTGQLLKPLGLLEEEDAFKAFAHQISVLDRCGVDLLVIETQFDLNEARVAIQAAKSVSELPIICSFSYDRGNRTMMGTRPEQMAEEISRLGVSMLGINCGRSLDENLANLKALRQASSLPIWFKPNAGLPTVDQSGNSIYSISPQEMGDHAAEWIDAGAKIIGGCCGTSPEHLHHIAAAAKK